MEKWGWIKSADGKAISTMQVKQGYIDNYYLSVTNTNDVPSIYIEDENLNIAITIGEVDGKPRVKIITDKDVVLELVVKQLVEDINS